MAYITDSMFRSHCIQQDVQRFDSKQECDPNAKIYVDIPADGDWDTVEYICKPVGPKNNLARGGIGRHAGFRYRAYGVGVPGPMGNQKTMMENELVLIIDYCEYLVQMFGVLS